MFIIYGKKEVSKTIGSGEFYCPNCRSEQPYWQKSVQEKGHIYWLSLLPMGAKMEIVQCRTCEELYRPDVLTIDPDDVENFNSDFELILRRLMVLMALADGELDESEVEMLVSVFEQITGKTLSRDEVLADVADAESSGNTVAEYLPALAEGLSGDGKAVAVQALHLIAAADGEIHDSEAETLFEIAAGLGMSQEEFDSALDLENEN